MSFAKNAIEMGRGQNLLLPVFVSILIPGILPRTKIRSQLIRYCLVHERLNITISSKLTKNSPEFGSTARQKPRV